MFDVGFSELVVIALVALIVIGPERLPRVARTVGALLGRAQRYVNDVKADIQREVDLDEMKNIRSTLEDAAKSVVKSVSQVGDELQAAGEALNQNISSAGESKPGPAAEEPLTAAPVSAPVETPAVSVQMDLALESKPAAEPAPVPKA